jgi:hypothetical protein
VGGAVEGVEVLARAGVTREGDTGQDGGLGDGGQRGEGAGPGSGEVVQVVLPGAVDAVPDDQPVVDGVDGGGVVVGAGDRVEPGDLGGIRLEHGSVGELEACDLRSVAGVLAVGHGVGPGPQAGAAAGGLDADGHAVAEALEVHAADDGAAPVQACDAQVAVGGALGGGAGPALTGQDAAALHQLGGAEVLVGLSKPKDCRIRVSLRRISRNHTSDSSVRSKRLEAGTAAAAVPAWVRADEPVRAAAVSPPARLGTCRRLGPNISPVM